MIINPTNVAPVKVLVLLGRVQSALMCSVVVPGVLIRKEGLLMFGVGQRKQHRSGNASNDYTNMCQPQDAVQT